MEAAFKTDGTGYTRYEAFITNSNYALAGEYKCLISQEASENDPVGKPWLDLTAYQIITVTVQPKTNLPPTANAAPDKVLTGVGQPIQFDASDSVDNDCNGQSIVKYEWQWSESNPFVVGTQTAEHDWDTEGEYDVQLRVTDDEGSTDTLDVPIAITVTDNQCPTAFASANPNPQQVNLPVKFDGSDSWDPDGTIESYEWDWENDGVFDEQGATAQHSWDFEGVYYIQLRVRDNEGCIDLLDGPLEIIITVTGNECPEAIAWFDPDPQLAGQPVSFYDNGSFDNNGAIVIYEWDWDNDGVYDEMGQAAEHTWNNTGTYYVQFRVTDDDGCPDELDQPLQVHITSISNECPTAMAGVEPNPKYAGLPVSFFDDGSFDPDGFILNYEWDWDNDGVFDDQGQNIEHAFPAGGTYYVQFRVTDDLGCPDELDQPIEVVIEPYFQQNPFAHAVAVPNPQFINETVTLQDDGSYDPDGGLIVKYEWDWNNDGTYDEEGVEADHSWASPGTYHVQLRVTDDEAQTDTLDEPLEVVILPESGSLNWAKRAGGTSNDYGWGITTLSDNSTVVTGSFEGDATFGPGETNQTVLTSVGYSDIFIARYYPDGTLAWAKRAGGTSSDHGIGITTLSDNSTVVTGYFNESATFGPGETNQTVLISAGEYDIFIARYNPDGILAWAKRAGGASSSDAGSGITTLSDNSTVVTGYFKESATFGPGELNQIVLTSAGIDDIFIARYNPEGTLAWAKHAGGPSSDLGFGITTLSDNSTVETGWFGGSATFGPGEPNETVLTSAGDGDIFIARYNPDGTLAWAKRAGGLSSDLGHGITTLSDNSTVVTGYFKESATFGPGEPYQAVLTSAGDYDIFITRYNPDGTLAWAKRAGGASGYDYGNGITTLSDNSTVVTGDFYESATFGPGDPNQTVLTSSGLSDIFIARYNPDGTLAWAKSAGGTYFDQSFAITTLLDNSTVVTGDFYEPATFGPGELNQTVLTSAGDYDMFIARFYE